MPEFTQLPLPGMPVRFVVSAVWESGDRPCTVRATLDVPSDQFSSQIIGYDTEGRMTLDELQAAMETLLDAVIRAHPDSTPGTSILGSAVDRMNSHLRSPANNTRESDSRW